MFKSKFEVIHWRKIANYTFWVLIPWVIFVIGWRFFFSTPKRILVSFFSLFNFYADSDVQKQVWSYTFARNCKFYILGDFDMSHFRHFLSHFLSTFIGILKSSKFTKSISASKLISLELASQKNEPSSFNEPDKILGLTVEGKTASLFKNRIWLHTWSKFKVNTNY